MFCDNGPIEDNEIEQLGLQKLILMVQIMIMEL